MVFGTYLDYQIDSSELWHVVREVAVTQVIWDVT